MRYFGILIGKSGPVPDSAIARGVKSTTTASKTVGTGAKPVVWKSKSGHLVVIAWGDDGDVGLYRGKLILEEGPHALVGTGYYFDSAYDSDDELLRALVRTESPETILRKLGGVFSLCICDAVNNTVRVANTLASQPNIFYAETKDLIVISSRGLFLGLNVHETPRYNVSAFGQFVITDFFPSDELPYLGTKDMPANTILTANPDGLSIEFIDEAYEEFGLCDPEPNDQDFDDASDMLAQSILALTRAGVRLRLGLSGGKDSRVLAAGLHHVNADCSVRFSANWPDHPDLILGQKVANLLEFETEPHRMLDDEYKGDTAEINLDEWLVRTLRGYDGLHAVGMSMPMLAPKPIARQATSEVHLAGTGGEVLRGGFARKDCSHMFGVTEFNRETMEAVARKILGGNTAYLHPSSKEGYEHWMADYIEREYSSDHPEALLERLYLFVNQARRVTCGVLPYEFDPLLDNRLLRHVARFSAGSRTNELWHFELIRRLSPGLEMVPLADNRWGFEASGLGEIYEAGYSAREPLKLKWGTRASNYVRFTAMTDLRAHFEKSLLEDHYDVLASCLDMDALKHLMRSRDAYEYKSASIFWLSHAAALILSNRWLEDRPISPPQTVRLDSPWHAIYYQLTGAVDAGVTGVLNAVSGMKLPSSLPDLTALQGAEAEGFEQQICRFTPEKIVLETGLFDQSTGKMPIQLQPEPNTSRLTDKKGGNCIEFSSPAKNPTWAIFPIGEYEQFAGAELVVRVSTQGTSTSFAGTAYLMVRPKNANSTQTLDKGGLKADLEESPQTMSFVVPTGSFDPDDPVEVWLPLGDGSSPFVFRKFEWETRRWQVPENELLNVMNRCATVFRQEFNARFQPIAERYHLKSEMLDDASSSVALGGSEETFTLLDLTEEKPATLKFYIDLLANASREGKPSFRTAVVQTFVRLQQSVYDNFHITPVSPETRLPDSSEVSSDKRLRSWTAVTPMVQQIIRYGLDRYKSIVRR